MKKKKQYVYEIFPQLLLMVKNNKNKQYRYILCLMLTEKK